MVIIFHFAARLLTHDTKSENYGEMTVVLLPKRLFLQLRYEIKY